MVANQISAYQCYYEECGKTFVTRFNLRRHVNVSHLAIKAFTCEICSKHFASKQNVKEHRFIHTGEKPFLCSLPGCGRCFRQASQLATHRKTHFRPHEGTKMLLTGHSLLALLASSLKTDKAFDVSLTGRPTARVYIPLITEEHQRPVNKLPIAPALLDFN